MMSWSEGGPLGSSGAAPGRSAPGWHWWLLFFALALAGAVVLIPNFLPAGNYGPLTACKSNCKNLATALEMYASDNEGGYPPHLGYLIRGSYLRRVPSCPRAGEETYSEAYVRSRQPDEFSFYCRGKHHEKDYRRFPGDPRNFPQYHSAEGLRDHP